jgi:hypothetical protein
LLTRSRISLLMSHDGFVSEGFFIRKNGLLQNKISQNGEKTTGKWVCAK